MPTSPDVLDVLPALRAALSAHFERELGESLQALETLEVLPRPYSTILFLRADSTTGSRRLVSKTVRHHPDNQALIDRANQAVIEFEVLERLWRRFTEVEKCFVPRPILVLPELETYVMEFVEGRLLAEELRHARYFAPRSGFDLLCESYRHWGRWLKHFHDFTGVRQTGPEALETVLERCADRLQRIEQIDNPRWPNGLTNAITLFLREQQALLDGESILVAGRHGDLGPWNVLGNPGGVAVLDFLGYQEDPIAVDLLSVLMVLENERRCFTSSPARIEVLRRHFLKGFGPIPRVQRPVLLICETLHRLSSVSGCLSRAADGLHHRLESRWRLRANLNWLRGGNDKRLLWPGDPA